ncbi:nucleoside deaminase [Gemmatimonadota bacterium]
MSHETFLRRAIELAELHSAGGMNGPFGAVVVRGGEIVGEGWNRVVETSDPTAHAEVVAIRDAARRTGIHDLAGCVIYCSCEPCPMCISAIHWARIGEVYYACTSQDAAQAGFDDARILRELLKEEEDRSVPRHQALREVGLRVLEEWRRNPRRVLY